MSAPDKRSYFAAAAFCHDIGARLATKSEAVAVAKLITVADTWLSDTGIALLCPYIKKNATYYKSSLCLLPDNFACVRPATSGSVKVC